MGLCTSSVRGLWRRWPRRTCSASSDPSQSRCIPASSRPSRPECRGPPGWSSDSQGQLRPSLSLWSAFPAIGRAVSAPHQVEAGHCQGVERGGGPPGRLSWGVLQSSAPSSESSVMSLSRSTCFPLSTRCPGRPAAVGGPASPLLWLQCARPLALCELSQNSLGVLVTQALLQRARPRRTRRPVPRAGPAPSHHPSPCWPAPEDL